MTFNDVLKDIEKLKGLKLSSIRPGADITIQDINYDEERVELKTTSDVVKSRAFGELKKIWDALCEEQVVHVDRVLGGSGSSRNQPETIFANLPYIEWLEHERKKHIALMGKNTHHYGVLKKMDAIEAEKVREHLRAIHAGTGDSSQIIIVAGDILQAAQKWENITGVPVKPISSGVYGQSYDTYSVLLVARNMVPSTVEPGTYMVIKKGEISQGGTPCKINGHLFYAIRSEGVCIMIACGTTPT